MPKRVAVVGSREYLDLSVWRCDAVAAFWDGASGGTLDTVEKARAAW